MAKRRRTAPAPLGGTLRCPAVPKSITLGAIALLLPAAASAAEPDAAAAEPTPGPVPGIPMAEDIDALDPIPLRREISRAEGRISDLMKARDTALAGLDAAIAEARAGARATAAAGSGAAEASLAGSSTMSRPAETSPLLDPDLRAARRRAIEARYADRLADARRRLARLLARQARIDPDAPDQERLGQAAGVGMVGP